MTSVGTAASRIAVTLAARIVRHSPAASSATGIITPSCGFRVRQPISTPARTQRCDRRAARAASRIANQIVLFWPNSSDGRKAGARAKANQAVAEPAVKGRTAQAISAVASTVMIAKLTAKDGRPKGASSSR